MNIRKKTWHFMTTVSVLLTEEKKQNKTKNFDTQIELKLRCFSTFLLTSKTFLYSFDTTPFRSQNNPSPPLLHIAINKYLTQANVRNPGSSFDKIKHSNHIGHYMFVIQFLIWAQCIKDSPTNSCMPEELHIMACIQTNISGICPVHVHIHCTVC